MGRMYTQTLSAASVTEAVELFFIEPASDNTIIIHEVKVTQDDSETSEQIKFQCFKATTTAGTRGDAGVVVPLDAGDAAFGGTARSFIETADGFSTDSPLSIWVEAQNALNGLHILPTPEGRPVITGGEGFAVKVESVHTLTMSGYVIFEEIGG